MKKHFVIFFSPGTFVAEQTTKEIESWDVEKATEMARDIKERYNATPYGFQFVTQYRGKDELDSKETKRSGVYYLGGKVWTLAELKKRNNPQDRILISNMSGNGWNKVVENTNSYRWWQPFLRGDKILGYRNNQEK